MADHRIICPDIETFSEDFRQELQSNCPRCCGEGGECFASALIAVANATAAPVRASDRPARTGEGARVVRLADYARTRYH